MVWDENSGMMKPMAYPWDDRLSPALSGTFEVDGKIYKTGFTLLWERVADFTPGKGSGHLLGLIKRGLKLQSVWFTEHTPGGLALGVATDQTPNSVQAAMAAATIDLLMEM